MWEVEMNGFAVVQLETLIRSSHVRLSSTAVTKESFLSCFDKFEHNFKLSEECKKVATRRKSTLLRVTSTAACVLNY